jgi:hypothetical protein
MRALPTNDLGLRDRYGRISGELNRKASGIPVLPAFDQLSVFKTHHRSAGHMQWIFRSFVAES